MRPDPHLQATPAFGDPTLRPAAHPTAIASTVVGALGLFSCVFGLLAGPLAVGLGLVARARAQAEPARYTQSPLAVAGIVLGVLSFLAGGVSTAGLALAVRVVGQAQQEVLKQLEEQLPGALDGLRLEERPPDEAFVPEDVEEALPDVGALDAGG